MLIFIVAVFGSCSVLLWVLFSMEKRRIRRLQMEAQRQELERINRLNSPGFNSDDASNYQSGSEPTDTTHPPQTLPPAAVTTTVPDLPAAKTSTKTMQPTPY
jgi:hypothetical protein